MRGAGTRRGAREPAGAGVPERGLARSPPRRVDVVLLVVPGFACCVCGASSRRGERALLARSPGETLRPSRGPLSVSAWRAELLRRLPGSPLKGGGKSSVLVTHTQTGEPHHGHGLDLYPGPGLSRGKRLSGYRGVETKLKETCRPAGGQSPWLVLGLEARWLQLASWN